LKSNGQVLDLAGVEGRDIAADEEDAVLVPRGRRIADADTVGEKVHELDSLRRGHAPLESFHQAPRRRTRAPDEHSITGLDPRDGHLGGNGSISPIRLRSSGHVDPVTLTQRASRSIIEASAVGARAPPERRLACCRNCAFAFPPSHSFSCLS
jgi:hypothetical protein